MSISREPAGNTATTDQRSQRIRASRRGGQITARALSPWFKGRPARTHVLPAPHVPDGLTIRPLSEESSGTTKAPGPSCRLTGRAERFHKTVLDEFYRVAFRKRIYGSIAKLQADL